MNNEDLDNFEKLHALLHEMHEEIGLLSNKKPHDAVNKFKLKFINQGISGANLLLGPSYIPFPDFVEFDEDELPSNSDVSFILSSYLAVLEKFRSDNITRDRGSWYWLIDGKKSLIETNPPNRLVRKTSG